MRLPREATLQVDAALLAAIGAGIATYIAIADAAAGAPACFPGADGCATVAASAYSHLAGVNVAAFGVGGYLLLLAAALLPGDMGRFAGFGLALAGLGFSAYLTYLELFVIHAICQWCLISAVVMSALFVLNLARAFGYAGAARRGSETGGDPSLGRRQQDQGRTHVRQS